MKLSENAQALKLYAETSDSQLYRAIAMGIKNLQLHMKRVARDLAKSRADWMDDPEDERYEAWHADAATQFTEADKLRVLRAMVCHHIDELLIQEDARKAVQS